MVIRRFIQSLLGGSKGLATNDVASEALRSIQPDTLPATALQLARQCVLLKRTGTDLAAVWGGDGVVPPPAGPYRHWISVDTRYLPANFGSSGVLSVYTNEEDCVSGVAVFSSTAALTADKGENLFAHFIRSLPPPDASPDLENQEYTEQWMHQCPIYNGKDVLAVLGGWHFPWPDGDWEVLRDRSLLVWTLEGSEPWVEVWQADEGTMVMQRIT